MTYQSIASRTKWFGKAAAVAAASLLAGCASTLSANVTSFQQWPSGVAGETYGFAAPTGGQVNNLEYSAYQDMVRAAIGATGLVEAAGGAPGRFSVSFRYGTENVQVIRREPVDPYFYGGYGPGYYGPWGWGGYYGPAWVAVPVTAWRNSLTVEIRDNRQNGAEVYRSTATAVTGRDALPQVMPYLVRAVFDNFPGNNGQVREVRYRRD